MPAESGPEITNMRFSDTFRPGLLLWTGLLAVLCLPLTSQAQPSGAQKPAAAHSPAEAAAIPKAFALPPLVPGVQPHRVNKTQTPEQRADQRYLQAWELARQNQVSQATRQLRAILAERPGHQASRLLLSQLMMSQGQMQQARETLEQGLGLQPGSEALRMGLARLEVHLGELRKAQALLDATTGGPRSAEYRALHAMVLQSQDLHARAIDEFAAALREQPGHAPWLVGLGVSLHAQGRQSAAQEAFALARASASFTPELDAVVRRYSTP